MPKQRSKSTNNYGLDMRFFSWLKNWLTSSKDDGLGKGHPDLSPIDIEALARLLDLKNEAERLGKAGIPYADATGLSGPEAGIVQKVEKARQDYVDWGSLRLNILNQDLARCDSTQDVNRARQADKEFERKASALLSEHESTLRSLRESADSKRQELKEFKSKNGLVREAHFPSGSKSFYLYAILAAFIVAEGLLNATFFSQGMDTGLIGGFISAGILAAVNVTSAFVLGKYLVRYMAHRNAALKFGGIIVLALTFIWLGTVALAIAHYRDALTTGVEMPERAVLDSLAASPFLLKDVFSWALFCISIGFGIGAMIDGLKSDDKYPGYGAITRRTDSAIEEHEDELDGLREDLEELKNGELAALDTCIDKAKADASMFESLINDKHMAYSRLQTAMRDADNSLEALLRRFRTENEVHRGGVPRPAYFDTQPELRTIHMPDFGTATDEQALEAQKAVVSNLLSELEEIRGRIQAAFNQHFDRLKPLNNQFSAILEK